MSRTRREIVLFAVAGVAGLASDIAVLYLMQALGAGPYLGRVFSFLSAVWVTWQINRRYTFVALGRTGLSLWRQWWTYLGAMLGGGAVNYAAYCALIALAPPLPMLPSLAVAVGSLAGMTVNFASAKFIVFRR